MESANEKIQRSNLTLTKGIIMGAETQIYEVKCKKSELKEKANDLRDDARYDWGNSGYTGTIAEDNGELNILDTPMSESDAEDYIYENAEKWGATLAIPVLNKEDTFILGGCYSS